MRILVTGAAGFIGRHVVRVALERGHHVVAVSRRELDPQALSRDGSLETMRADLGRPAEIEAALPGVEAVIHLAAAKAGDLAAQTRATVDTTAVLLEAMATAGTRRLVHVSSFSVYDYRAAGDALDEESALESRPEERDVYARVKLEQERRVRAFCDEHEIGLTVLRPGVVFGSRNEWTARLGVRAGRFWVLTGTRASLPLTYVENCAAAIVLAVEKDAAIGETLNIVDDELPTQRTYAQELRCRRSSRPMLVPVPWAVMHGLARLVSSSNRVLGNWMRVPGILVPAQLCARARPLQYSNAKAKRVLSWVPRYGWQEGLERCSPESVA